AMSARRHSAVLSVALLAALAAPSARAQQAAPGPAPSPPLVSAPAPASAPVPTPASAAAPAPGFALDVQLGLGVGSKHFARPADDGTEQVLPDSAFAALDAGLRL